MTMGETNSVLSIDLIEPFRPLVDLQMLQIDLTAESADNLSRSARREMTSVLRSGYLVNGSKPAA